MVNILLYSFQQQTTSDREINSDNSEIKPDLKQDVFGFIERSRHARASQHPIRTPIEDESKYADRQHRTDPADHHPHPVLAVSDQFLQKKQSNFIEFTFGFPYVKMKV